MLRKVRSCLLEVELSGEPHVIERSVGEPSKVAFVRRGTLDSMPASRAESRLIDPPGAPESLSSLLLRHCKPEGVQLREAPTNSESRTDPLSFRDLMWLAFLPNERVADKNFLFENDYMRKHKLRQVLDVAFGVHDDRAVELGRRVQELGGRLNRAQAELAAARTFVVEQTPTALNGEPTPAVHVKELADIGVAAPTRCSLQSNFHSSPGISDALETVATLLPVVPGRRRCTSNMSAGDQRATTLVPKLAWGLAPALPEGLHRRHL